mmetsp:Transcript_16163/g.14098  ORF Transcript_16163/g.14098 Transcript_16163/m.14098 type:complete len:94 (+) Transcript_16163:1314-1595(+)
MHMPMVFIVGKESFLSLYLEIRYRRITRDWERKGSVSGDINGEIERNYVKEMDNIEYYVLTTCVFVLVFTIAYFVEDLGHLVSFMGTSTCFIL